MRIASYITYCRTPVTRLGMDPVYMYVCVCMYVYTHSFVYMCISHTAVCLTPVRHGSCMYVYLCPYV